MPSTMDRQPLRWFMELKSGQAESAAPKPGHRFCVTHAFLVDPAPASAGGRSVAVRVKTAGRDVVIGPLSAERPVAELLSTVMLDEEFCMMRDDDGGGGSGDAVVRVQGYVLAAAAPPSDAVDDEMDEEAAVLGDEEEVLGDDEEAAASEDDDAAPACSCERCGALLSDGEESQEAEFQEESDDDEEFYDSDDGSDEEESDGEAADVPLKTDGEAARASDGAVPPLECCLRRSFVPEGRFLGPAPRYATAGSTAGYMRVAAVESQQGGKQILVLYRYTHFSAASNGQEGVEARGSTRAHQLRFIVPPAGDAATSLPWAGSSLAPLIYPGRSSKELQELWSSLIAKVRVPPRATRVQVLVDVGILRRRDCTAVRMEHMHAALEDMMEESWPGYHVGMELHLPEPVRCAGGEAEATGNDDDVDGERPAKRRRVVAGEECAVCLELLESGIVAWPGCSKPHVFHGGCLELTLKENETCPICRRKLSTPIDEHEPPDK